MIRRRKFIKTTGALSLSTMLPWSSVFSDINSTQNSSSANDKIIVAVIGAGGRAKDNLKIDSIGPIWQTPATMGTSCGYITYEDK